MEKIMIVGQGMSHTDRMPNARPKTETGLCSVNQNKLLAFLSMMTTFLIFNLVLLKFVNFPFYKFKMD